MNFIDTISFHSKTIPINGRHLVITGKNGAGKTRFYCKPNIMQCNTSFVILDPKGEIVRDTGNLLIKEGFDPTLTEIQIQHGRGYYRIFDKGSIRYELKI